MDNTQRVSGSVQQIGPQSINPQSAIASATTTSAALLASIDARLAAAATGGTNYDGSALVSFSYPQQVWGDMGRAWALSSANDSVTVAGSVSVPGAALERGGNLDAINAQIVALTAAVAVLGTSVAQLAQSVGAVNGNLIFVLQQLNNIGATHGALTTTFQ